MDSVINFYQFCSKVGKDTDIFCAARTIHGYARDKMNKFDLRRYYGLERE